MNFLLDTHAFVWFVNGDRSLPDRVVAKIRKVENRCFLSIASIWEIAIKMKLNKIQLKSDFNEIAYICNANEIEILPITFEHLQELNRLDLHHGDLFDRLIIAQGLTDDLAIITKDSAFEPYGAKLLW